MPRNVIITQFQQPGDTLQITATLRDLHTSHPGAFRTDFHGAHRDLFDNSPYITPLEEHEAQIIHGSYTRAIQSVHARPRHFIEAVTETVSRALDVHIEPQAFRGEIYLSESEQAPWPGLPERYICLNAGWKDDFTAKQYSTARFQEMINALKNDVTFVQVGHAKDFHPALENCISLVGQTNNRQLCQVVYRSMACVTPISFLMHLCAAVPTLDCKVRPCVVLAGQREQAWWEALPGHNLLGVHGRLNCGVGPGGACWVNKAKKIVVEPGQIEYSACRQPTDDGHGQIITGCLARIEARHLIEAVGCLL